MRLLTVTQAQGSIPPGFLIVLILWLSIMFAGFGLARNLTALVAVLLVALSLAGAVFMIEELNQRLVGWMKVSGAPLRYAVIISEAVAGRDHRSPSCLCVHPLTQFLDIRPHVVGALTQLRGHR